MTTNPASLPVTKSTILCLGIISAITNGSISILLPALPSIRDHFNVSTESAQLLLSLSFIIMGGGHFLFGLLADRVQHKKLLLFSVCSFVAGSILSALAPTFNILLFGRCLQAAAASACFVMARVIAMNAGDRDTAAKNVSYILLPVTLTPLISLPLGGTLTDLFHWRWVFHSIAIAGLITIALTLFTVPKNTGTSNRPPQKVLQPVKQLLASWRFNLFNNHHGFAVAAVYVINAAAPIIIISNMGLSSSEFGTYAILPILGSVAGALLGGQLVRRVGGDSLIIVGSVIALASYFAIFLTAWSSSLTPWTLFIPMAAISFTNTLLLPSSVTGALEGHDEIRGTGSGLIGISQWLLASLFIQLTASYVEESESIVFLTSFLCYTAAVLFFYLGRKQAA